MFILVSSRELTRVAVYVPWTLPTRPEVESHITQLSPTVRTLKIISSSIDRVAKMTGGNGWKYWGSISGAFIGLEARVYTGSPRLDRIVSKAQIGFTK